MKKGNKMKTYITMDGLCFNPEGWTQEQYDSFIDKLIDVAESFGADVQFSCSYKLVTEDEIE